MSEEYNLEDFAPWLVVFITLAGAALRVLLLDYKGMWLDETFSVWLASHSISEMLQWIVRIDQHPPLYYLLLHYWMGLFGTQAYSVRLLSVLFGAITIPVVYWIGNRMMGLATGLAAALFMTFSLFNVFYAQETRMYTLLTFTVAVATYALVRLLTDPCSVKPIGSQFREYLQALRTGAPLESDRDEGFSYRVEARRRWLPIRALKTDLTWIVFVVFSVAALYTHNTAVLFPLATNIFVLGLVLYQKKNRLGMQTAFQAPSLGNWIKAQVGIFVLWSPWIIAFVRQAADVYQRFWIPKPTWDDVAQLLRSFLVTSASIPASLNWVVWLLFTLVLGLGLVGYRKKISQLLFLAALFTIPFLGELFVSIWRPIFSGRTLIWTTIPLFLLMGSGIAQLKFRPLIVLVMGSLCTIGVFYTSDYLRFYQKEDWNTAARSIAGYTEKDDLILFNSNFVEIPFDYYFKPYETLYSIEVEKRGVPQDLFESGVLEPEMTAQDVPGLIALLKGHKRVWLVYSHDLYTDPTRLIPQTLASQMKLIQTDKFNGGSVYLYTTP